MDEVVAAKTAAMNAQVEKLTEDYIAEFWDALKQIYGSIDDKERSGLAWKALYQREAFLDLIGQIRDQFVSDLNATRSCLSDEMLAEKSGFVDWKNLNASELLLELDGKFDELAGEADANTQDVLEKIEEIKEIYNTVDEIDTLKKFIYDLAAIRFNPSGYGRSHADGVQPYGRWVANRLEQTVADFGKTAISNFTAAIEEALGAAQNTFDSEKQLLKNESWTLQLSL